MAGRHQLASSVVVVALAKALLPHHICQKPQPHQSTADEESAEAVAAAAAAAAVTTAAAALTENRYA